MSENLNHELCADELSQASGGCRVGKKVNYVHCGNNIIGRRDANGTIYYYPCPKCGKPMHAGALNKLYCDPCNYKCSENPNVTWTGTEEELVAKAR